MGKRTSRPHDIEQTKRVIKSWDRHSRAGRSDMVTLKNVILMLAANDGPLPSEYKDHQLEGDLRQYRECHIGGDFLLMYEIDVDVLYLVTCGTHAELFE